MLFADLAKRLEKLEKTASRNEMTRILAEVLRSAEVEEVASICYLVLGELVPAYKGLEFNIAEKMMVRALEQAYFKDAKSIQRAYKTKGDLGDLAYELSENEKGPSPKKRLSVSEVYKLMNDVAEEAGEGSQGRKIKKMSELLSSLDPLSAKFVTRIPLGKLRLGFSDATLMDALSFMVKGDKSSRPEIERAYNVTADIGAVAKQVKKYGLASLKRIEPQPGLPIRPSLAERLKGIEEIIEKAGPRVGVEQKLDGLRTQIHVWLEAGKKEVRLFSRNLENTTFMFPEITDASRRLKVRSVILDGETIGYDPRTKKFMSFQETVQRKRKHDIAEFAKKIPLAIFVFDILYLDGKSLLGLPFRERRVILEKVFGPVPKGAIRLAEHLATGDPRVVAEELKKSLSSGLEGLVVKNLESLYEAGSRGFHWIKLKAASAALEKLRAGLKQPAAGMLDTIDCLVMGIYRGRGKRTKFGVGGFLLGLRDKDGRYYTISRLGTGLSDEQFREARRRAEKLRSPEMPKDYVVDKEIIPDIWLRPSLVAEILADEITLSPRHTAGRSYGASLAKPDLTGRKNEGGRGYSLRFPRLVRFRDDKNPEDATTVNEVEKMYGRRRTKDERRKIKDERRKL